MSSGAEFIHLHLHSQYSLLDGAIRLPDLIRTTKDFGMPAVAVTDHGNMFGTVDFYQQAIAAGIKPILGCEAYMSRGDRRDRVDRENYHIILLAKSDEGYRNLKYLVSMGYVEGFYYKPRVDKELLARHSAGLIGATACLGGEVATAFREGGFERAKDAARTLARLFEPGCFFLEVQCNGYPEQEAYNNALRRIGQDLDLPLVATNDAHYLTAADAKAHKALMCIPKGITLDDPKAGEHYSNELFFRTAAEMRAVLPHFPDAVENTLKITEMCAEVSPTNPIALPDFQLPAGVSLGAYLGKMAHDGLNRRFEEFQAMGKVVDKAVYRKRLDHELEVICEMGFAGYFLIVQDFIGHARRVRIPVGPGRGSGAGSLAAFSLRITNLDPIPLNLLFERFLNPHRSSMPDFDIDFCKDRREEVISYVVEKYGKDNVGQIATFHQLRSRSVVRDVGRVMGMAYADVDRIAKLVPEGPKVTLSMAFESEPRLKEARQADFRVDELLGYAERLENLNRHAGMHAAGVVISNKPLWEYVPVFKGSDKDQVTQLVSQFDMNFVEKAGLVKFDFLGLKTLTVIDTATRLIDKRPDRREPVDIDRLLLDDPAVYRLISSGDTWGVFQLESRGFQELLRKLQPDRFEDVVAAVALYRPGPLEGGMVDKFVECKHGRLQIEYPHARLEPVLKETYGVIVYQEQVMQAAQLLAGYTLGAADIMRRAMGKKKKEEMAKERLKFVAGAEQNRIDAGKANEIFDLIDKFSGYGFNKSHSAAYALITYQTAWLKAHYPVEFLAALLTSDREDTDKIARYIRAGKGMGITVLPPDINRSEQEFSVRYAAGDPPVGKILFGLGAIKGVGDAALGAIVEARADGPFADLFDFATRVDLTRVNKAVIESLVRAGAFDSVYADRPVNRGRLFGAIDLAQERGRAAQRDRESGQISLFGALAAPRGSSAAALPPEETVLTEAPPWDERRLLAEEKAALGFYMSGHPMERYTAEIARLTDCDTEKAALRRPNEKVSVAGMVMDYSERSSKSGKRFATFALEDLQGRVDVVVYSDALKEHAPALASDEPVFVTGVIRMDDRGDEEKRTIILREVSLVSRVRSDRTSAIYVVLDADAADNDTLGRVKETLGRHPGRCDTFVKIVIPERAVTTVALPGQLRADPCDALLDGLGAVKGVKTVELR